MKIKDTRTKKLLVLFGSWMMGTILLACQTQPASVTSTTVIIYASEAPTHFPTVNSNEWITPEPFFTETDSANPYPMLEILPEEETETPTPTFEAEILQEPQVVINVDRTLYKVGEQVTITAMVSNIQQAAYDIIVRDEDVQEDTPVAQINSKCQISFFENDSKILELESGTATGRQITLIFKAIAQGKTTLTINAFGENSSSTTNIPVPQMGSAELVIVVEK